MRIGRTAPIGRTARWLRLGALLAGGLTVLVACSGTSSSSAPEPTAPQAKVPPLHADVDGWPESEITVDGAGGDPLVVKVAASPERRSRGLMEVPQLPDGTGMLFLFDSPRTGGFWMKNTIVALDIAYLLDGEVVSVREMEPCAADPCPSYPADSEFDAALEVGRGGLTDLGISVGDRLSWTEPVEVAA